MSLCTTCLCESCDTHIATHFATEGEEDKVQMNHTLTANSLNLNLRG